MPETKDITGLKFNRLTAIQFEGKVNGKVHLWLFKCDCGKEVIKRKPYVTSGHLKSCGCLQREAVSNAFKIHGLTKHPLWKVWMGIRARCYNVNSQEYHKYGERGVKMSKEWAESFKPFYDWCILNGWRKGMHIDKDILSKKLGLKIPVYSPEYMLYSNT